MGFLLGLLVVEFGLLVGLLAGSFAGPWIRARRERKAQRRKAAQAARDRVDWYAWKREGWRP